MNDTDFADEDRATLARVLRETVAADRFPLSPRIRELRAIVAKAQPRSGSTPTR